MSWSTYRAEIVTALTGYSINTKALDVENLIEGQNHKYCTLRLDPSFIDDRFLEASKVIGVYNVELSVIYRFNSTSEYATNEGLFETLINTINALQNMKGIISISFTKITENKQKGILRFYYGNRTC